MAGTTDFLNMASWTECAVLELSRPRRLSLGGGAANPERRGPITVAERNRLINKAAAKSRHNTKRKAAKKARKGKS